MSSDAVTVFVSYSDKDEKLLDELKKHLATLSEISVWHRQHILPGDDREREINDNRNAAQIILLLVSSDFLNSSYNIIVEEVERHKAKKAHVMAVILRPCMWRESEIFNTLDVLPEDGTPVTKCGNLDDSFTNIAKGIQKAANDIQQKFKNESETRDLALKLKSLSPSLQDTLCKLSIIVSVEPDFHSVLLNELGIKLEVSDLEILKGKGFLKEFDNLEKPNFQKFSLVDSVKELISSHKEGRGNDYSDLYGKLADRCYQQGKYAQADKLWKLQKTLEEID